MVNPVHRVVEHNTNRQKVKEIYRTEEMVTLLAVSKNSYLALIRTAQIMFKKRILYLLNLKTGTEIYSRFIHVKKEEKFKDIIIQYYPEVLEK